MLKKQKCFAIETKSMRTKLLRNGIDLSETKAGFNEVVEFYYFLINTDPSGLDIPVRDHGGWRFYELLTIGKDVQYPLPFEDSDITANAVKGRGGNIQITTQGIFRSPESDITASSELGINGTVQIETPDIDPSRGLVALSAELVDVTRLIAQACPAGGGSVASSEFIVTGRGGLPPNPSEPISSETVWVDLRPTTVSAENQSGGAIAPQSSHPTAVPMVEAQGWVIDDNGKVVLTAQASTVTPFIPWLRPDACHGS